MKIKTLVLERFGPFADYEITFPKDGNICTLLTGKNNEGKSTIINALRILHSATQVAKRSSSWMDFTLRKKDTEDINIERSIHNYTGGEAVIRGIFSNDSEIEVRLNADTNLIYCYCSPYVPNNVSQIFGFIPPLGQLAEKESLISSRKHLLKSLNTTLAPRHLRNHFHQLLNEDQFTLVRTIVKDSWKDIELFNYEHDIETDTLLCLYKEDNQLREIAWAGQGLQIWLQIITHLVRLQNTSIMVLDEPEIFLHTEKQLDLIQILKEYYNGDIIIATHSVELMNSVDISHIIYVRKNQRKPLIKATSDRKFLEKVRSQLGSSFNLTASQFEDVDLLLFTESKYDFDVITGLAQALGITKKVSNVRIGGFSEYYKCVPFREAYEKFLGKKVQYSLLLDRDYYPEEYLEEVRHDLAKHGIKTILTPGKELENIFLDRDFLFSIVPSGRSEEFNAFLDEMFQAENNNCLGSLVTLHMQFQKGNRKDTKTILQKQKPIFDKDWHNYEKRLSVIGGKKALSSIRNFFTQNYGIRLPTKWLVEELAKSEKKEHIEKFIAEVYQM